MTILEIFEDRSFRVSENDIEIEQLLEWLVLDDFISMHSKNPEYDSYLKPVELTLWRRKAGP